MEKPELPGIAVTTGIAGNSQNFRNYRNCWELLEQAGKLT